MSGFFSRAVTFSEDMISRIQSAPYPAPTLINIRKDGCNQPEAIGTKIPKDLAYFAIRVNELFLKDGRSFFDTYDPMLLIMTEFLHGGVRVSVPFVVGTDQLKLPTTMPSPSSLRFNDILVCGPHPFRGGNLAVSVVLYKVERDNYAKDFLKFVGSLSSALGPTANLDLLMKVGIAFIDGLDTLLKTKGTVPLMGHRIEFDTTSISGLSSAFLLLTSDTKIREPFVRVTDGRLTIANEDGTERKYQDADYVLYSLSRIARRSDESSLPFYSMRKAALESVLSGEEGWKRAKATLLAIYQEMITSDDLIKDEADELFEQYKTELLEARKTLQTTNMLSTKGEMLSEVRNKLNRATAVLEMP